MRPIQFPLATMGWFWTAIVSAYFGSDRFEKITSSREIPYGQVFKGNLGKLKFIIKMCFAMFVASVVLQYFTGDDYCMESFFSALGSSCICYVTGNKLIDAQGNKDGSHAVDETGDDNFVMDQPSNASSSALDK